MMNSGIFRISFFCMRMDCADSAWWRNVYLDHEILVNYYAHGVLHEVLICSVKIAEVRGELPMRVFMFLGINWAILEWFAHSWSKISARCFFGRNWSTSRYTHEEDALWGFMRKELIGIVCESLETNHWLHESLTFLVEIPVGDN